MAEARSNYREAEHSFYDGLNGILIHHTAQMHGIKDTVPADFMITRREVEKIINIEVIDQKFQYWAAMGGK